MNNQSIYDQHAKAFSNVSAYVILKDGEKIGTIAFKYPRDGAGRLWCYLHIIGSKMVRGSASGYGYDKKSAALESACRLYDLSNAYYEEKKHQVLLDALSNIGGSDMEAVARKVGYLIVSAV